MQTFHEMLNTVSFRLLTGKVRKNADLWPLRDLLMELHGTMQKNAVDAFLVLSRAGHEDLAVLVSNDYAVTLRVLERDIQTIETYCRKNDIIRVGE